MDIVPNEVCVCCSLEEKKRCTLPCVCGWSELKISELFRKPNHTLTPFHATNHRADSVVTSRYWCHRNKIDVQHGNAFLTKHWNEVHISTFARKTRQKQTKKTRNMDTP